MQQYQVQASQNIPWNGSPPGESSTECSIQGHSFIHILML
jgi:hypothetical protein